MKINVFIDVDDTIFQSSKTVINILNERYNLSPQKTINDLKNWNYQSIYDKITESEIMDIYDSDEFFDKVTPNPDFLSLYNELHEKINFIVVTKGRKTNLFKKENKVKKFFPNMQYIGIPFLMNEYENFNKSSVNMLYGVQIDDRIDCLNTNASIKILIKNDLELPWNQYCAENIGNLYVASNFKDIKKILNFIVDNEQILTEYNE